MFGISPSGRPEGERKRDLAVGLHCCARFSRKSGACHSCRTGDALETVARHMRRLIQRPRVPSLNTRLAHAAALEKADHGNPAILNPSRILNWLPVHHHPASVLDLIGPALVDKINIHRVPGPFLIPSIDLLIDGWIGDV